jgi:SAM-dependent methyltransferase
MTDQTTTVRTTLAVADVHDAWTRAFHTKEAAQFFDDQFDRIAEAFRAAPPGQILDIGCGPGHHTFRLAQRGLRVVAADFSPAALEQVRAAARARHLEEQVEATRADLMDLPFRDNSFSRVLCYGVLMHVPDIRRALDELARILAPGGVLVVSEGNMLSLDNFAFAVVNRLRRRRHPATRHPAGLETLIDTPTGPLFIRHTNLPWLVREMEARGLRLAHRESGQFTEAYTRLPSPAASMVHRANRWLRHGPSRLSFGTILMFERPDLYPTRFTSETRIARRAAEGRSPCAAPEPEGSATQPAATSRNSR